MEPSLSPNFIERGGTTWCIYTHTYHFYSRHYQLHPQVIHRIKYDLGTVYTILYVDIPRIICQHGPSAVFQIPCDHQCLDLKKRSSPEASNPKVWLGWFWKAREYIGAASSLLHSGKKIIIAIYVMRDFDLIFTIHSLRYFWGALPKKYHPQFPPFKLISPSVNPVFWGRCPRHRMLQTWPLGWFLREYTKRCCLLGMVVWCFFLFLFGFEALGICGILWDNIKKTWWPRWFTVFFFGGGGGGSIWRLKKSKSIRDNPSHIVTSFGWQVAWSKASLDWRVVQDSATLLMEMNTLGICWRNSETPKPKSHQTSHRMPLGWMQTYCDEFVYFPLIWWWRFIPCGSVDKVGLYIYRIYVFYALLYDWL